MGQRLVVHTTVQILEAYWRDHPAWFGRPYGEYLHLGANQEMLRIALGPLPVLPSWRVLDVGTALGGNARWLSGMYGCSVEGVDRFKPAIVAARQLSKVQGLGELNKFVLQDAVEFPFSNSAFDLAVTADDEPSWSEIVRVLKPGGHVVGSSLAVEGRESFLAMLAEVGLQQIAVLDVTAYALAFYKAKEQEARLLVDAGLMRADDLRSLQMYTVDVYEAGGASHLLFRLIKTG